MNGESKVDKSDDMIVVLLGIANEVYTCCEDISIAINFSQFKKTSTDMYSITYKQATLPR